MAKAWTHARQSGLKGLNTAVMIAFSIIMILPFLWMLSTSFKLPIDVFKYPMEWIPSRFTWDNYREVWTGKYPFYLYYLNSLKLTSITVIGTLATSSLAGYAFAKIEFRGKEFLFLVYLATLMIPNQILLIPRYILFDWLHLVNTHWAIILPGLTNVVSTFLMRQFYRTVPGEYLEAAKLDGAGHLYIWLRVFTPLVKPAFVTVIILNFIWHWNEFESPLIFLHDKSLYTIPLGITNYTDEFGTNYSLVSTAAFCALIPMLVVYLICQKWIIEGIASSGLKG
ncbi:carbohydrate ABC transporter permease [Paenibacillus thalictri]|uniref:Carbohydrate ABC transporter permease n=1 Tax=Paenibacillus thalictri TaxID=2527873 RepID=A0A4Q9DY52_9BACL|nr:carbohydrate ABC transporter permease [Paenibacillus thalictri]TBL80823.1 carbohydrate ABC transporter permease [Paenibacillus thalictri]